MTADLLWVRQNVLPPAYHDETDWSCVCQAEMCWHCRDGQHDECNTRVGWWRTGELFRETEIADSLGRRIGYEGSLVLVWLAGRTCRQFGCICTCRLSWAERLRWAACWTHTVLAAHVAQLEDAVKAARR